MTAEEVYLDYIIEQLTKDLDTIAAQEAMSQKNRDRTEGALTLVQSRKAQLVNVAKCLEEGARVKAEHDSAVEAALAGASTGAFEPKAEESLPHIETAKSEEILPHVETAKAE